MPEELEETGELSPEESQAPEAEESPEATPEDLRSPEEIAAEEQMLAELENEGQELADSSDASSEDAEQELRSPEEVAAEQAILAELEASAFTDVELDDGLQADFGTAGESEHNIELLRDVTVNVTVELGRKEMCFGEVLTLGKGSLVELSKVADEPVDIYVNRSKVAEGEVVVVDDHFGVRITRLMSRKPS